MILILIPKSGLSDITKPLPFSIEIEDRPLFLFHPILVIVIFRHYESSICQNSNLDSRCLYSVGPVPNSQVARKVNTHAQTMKLVLRIMFAHKLDSIQIGVLALSHAH